MQKTIEVLKRCSIEGNVVKLPAEQLDRTIYLDVKKRLELIGGKVAGFVFADDPSDLLAQIAGGEKRDLKKEFQFFATPDGVADWLVELAEIEEGMCVLEPSAGQGAIIEAVYRKFPRTMEGPNDKPSVAVDYCELMEVNSKIISKKLNANKNWLSRTSCMGTDFLQYSRNTYHRIVANPPFSKNQDIDHIRHMYDLLRPGGRLVSVASKHWQHSKNKKEAAFREWLEELGAEVHEIEAGRFKESGTMIATCVVIINKK